MGQFNLENYSDVNERIPQYHEKYEDFRMDSDFGIYSDTKTGKQMWWVKVYLYRTYADAVPFTTGLAAEDFTKPFGLELAETSAYGRALANGGWTAKKDGTKAPRASRQEMERVNLIQVENPSDPWTVRTLDTPKPASDAALDLLNQQLGAEVVEQAPSCRHGVMQLLEGTSSKTGKPYKGYKCTANIQPNGAGLCETIWYELAPNGSWRPQKPKGK